jgi:hypothetical protein
VAMIVAKENENKTDSFFFNARNEMRFTLGICILYCGLSFWIKGSVLIIKIGKKHKEKKLSHPLSTRDNQH